MAILGAVSPAAYLYRSGETPSNIDINATYCFMAWVKTPAAFTATKKLFNFTDATNAYWDEIWNNGATGTIRQRCSAPAGSTIQSGSTLSTSTWYHIAMVRYSATDARVYIDGTQSGSTNTRDVSGRDNDPIRLHINTGWNGSAYEPGDYTFAAVKLFNVSLTQVEIQAEARRSAPRRRAGVYAWWPMLQGSSYRLLDYSGNVRPLSEGGTTSDANDPPLAFARPRPLSRIPAAAAGNVTVTPTTAALTISTFAPTVSTPIVATPTTLALTLTPFAPVIALAVTPTTATLALTTFAPTIVNPQSATPTTATLTLTTFAPTAAVPRLVTPSTVALDLTEFAPTVSTPILAVPTTIALDLTEFAPTVAVTVLVTPSTLALTLETFAPTIVNPQSATPTTAALTLTGFAPTVTAGGSVTVVPTTADLVLTEFVPTISTPVLVTTTTVALTLTELAPQLRLGVIVPKTDLTLTEFAPRIGLTVIPGTSSLILTEFAPTVTIGGGVIVVPGAAALTLQGYPPFVGGAVLDRLGNVVQLSEIYVLCGALRRIEGSDNLVLVLGSHGQHAIRVRPEDVVRIDDIAP